MTKLLLPLVAISLASTAHAAPSTNIISTKYGPIKITAKFHASTQIEYRGKVIVVDPVMAASWTKKADLILITHPHGDHLDLPAIAKLKKYATRIVTPPALKATVETIKGVSITTLEPDEEIHEFSGSLDEADGTVINAIPAYNLVRGPKPEKKYHPSESNWNGYILTLGGKRIYFAGDTETTPEMKSLKNIDAAFLPMNLPYTMTPAEAAEAAKAFKPARVYPYHYRSPFDKDSGNEKTFTRLMKGTKTKVILLDWYPKAAVQKMMAATKK